MQNYFTQLETEQRVGAQGYKKKEGKKKKPKTEQCKREASFSLTRKCSILPEEEFMCLFVCCSALLRNKELLKQSGSFGGIPQIRG